MIPLRISADAPDAALPFVVRVGRSLDEDWPREMPSAKVIAVDSAGVTLETPAGRLHLKGVALQECAGDVLLVFPETRIAHRLIRARSLHNTFLVTEQCDQSCVMCSQPPKKHHLDLFPYFEAAAMLAPSGMVIGISGGEPTLHKEPLLAFLTRTLAKRPDLRFHVLTNAQHFEEEDCGRLCHPDFRRVTWGIPLYADEPALHDRIVRKEGAFSRLMESFAVLARSGALIELRSVLLRQNADCLPALASFIAGRLPFITRWAIMQLENIGYARQNWAGIFYDHSTAFGPLGAALDIGRARGIDVRLYNFPLCTVPEAYRTLADRSISDWKRRYLPVCVDCRARERCTGFFEWYPEKHGFMNIAPQ